MIHVGDKVKIGYTGAIYSSYPGFLDYYKFIGTSAVEERVCSQYALNHSPTDEEVRDKVFTVYYVREHGSLEGRILAVINDGNVTYIINVNALTLVSSDLPFSEGDKVYIKDVMGCYSSWDRLLQGVSSVIPDHMEVCRKWTDGVTPSESLEGGKSPDAIFTVKWVGHHITRPEEAIIAIISNNNKTFIMGVNALAKAGEKSWEKYIIYVRNWAVVNKDNAQSVRDAMGPKPYAEWLNGRR